MTSRFWVRDFQILKAGSHDFLIQKVSASTVQSMQAMTLNILVLGKIRYKPVCAAMNKLEIHCSMKKKMSADLVKGVFRHSSNFYDIKI